MTTHRETPGFGPDLLGRSLRDLRISVTDRCNFRCPYCMPAEIYGERYEFLPKPEILSYEEIERLARIFVEAGARKIRVTGGEPLLRRDLPRLIERLAKVPGVEDLTLTTNGYFLAAQAEPLREAGLRRVTVSLDSLDEEVFEKMNGFRGGLDRVLAGIEAAERAGLRPIKVNCVVIRGMNDETILDLARFFRGSGKIVRFIEFMDVGTRNRWDLSRVVTAREIVERIGSVFPLEPVSPGYEGEVASRYRYRDGQGEIGVIASVSEPFCGDCTRARLSPDGRLFTCLFAKDGTDLKGPLRADASDEELRAILAGVWSRRTDRYSEERTAETKLTGGGPSRGRIEMYQIGG
jgi:cyclic pyranopterin phosphate synthase